MTPGGRTVTVYSNKKKGPARCQITGQVLSGISRSSKKSSKNSKRPTRPFGGALSPFAMKRMLMLKAREDKE